LIKDKTLGEPAIFFVQLYRNAVRPVRTCPFCGEYCNISGSFEQVHYFLVRVNEDETEELLDSYIPPGDEHIDEFPDNLMRTSSVLQLRTKARFPWRLTNRDEDPISGPEFIA